MTTKAPRKSEYLERLRDLLPYRDGSRIVEEVDGLIEDRIEAEREGGATSEDDAERRALDALGPAEHLAAELVTPPITVDLATRRTFTRLLAITFAVHLLLSIVLTVAGTGGAAIPGLLGPLPREPFAALVTSALSIFLVDTGGLFLVFALLGRGKAPRHLPVPRLRVATSRRDAVTALVLLGLVVLILHPFRDHVFAVRDGERMVPILAPDLVSLMPFVDVALGLLAARQLAILLAGAERVTGVLADALASIALAAVLLLAATRGELVRFPEVSLGHRGALLLSDLTTRVLLLVFVGAALFLTVRFVKRCLRLRQILASA